MMSDTIEDQRRRMMKYPIEEYEKFLPQLERKRKQWQLVGMTWSIFGWSQTMFYALGVTGELSLVAAGSGTIAGLAAIAVANTKRNQITLIRQGSRPIGITEKLDRARRAGSDEPVKGFADQIEEIRAEAEREAENVDTQWWRQPGSVWHETAEFIDATNKVFEDAERAQRLRDEEERAKAAQEHAAKLERERSKRQAEYEKEAERQRQLQAEREKQHRIEQTKRWLEEQREWDAFKEDSQIDARERKERGEWYEPPMGVPGAIWEAEEERRAQRQRAAQAAADREAAEELRRARRELAAHEAQLNRVLGRSYSAPSYTYNSVGICSITGRDILTRDQAYAQKRQMNEIISSTRAYYKVEFCSNHYHVALELP
jgi:hypothetical protein